jgi:hypothetical protein
VLEPQANTLRRAGAICREGAQVCRTTVRAVTNLDHRHPCRVQPTDLDNGPLHRPGNQPVTAHKGPDGRDLRMDQRRHDKSRRVLDAQQELLDSREPDPDTVCVRRRTQARELLRHLSAAARAAHL